MYIKIKKIVFLLLLLSFILTLTTASANENLANDAISADEDGNMENISVKQNSNSFSDIQNEIYEAEENSTIILNGTYVGSGKEIVINKSITLEGMGGNTILDANSNSAILNIASGHVTVKNLNFINGKSVFSGGAIHAASELTIINCTFKNNTVDTIKDRGMSASEIYNQQLIYGVQDIAYGGAVYSESDLVVIDSRFIENNAISEVYYREMDMYWSESSSEGGSIYSKGNIILNRSYFSKANSESYEIVCNNLTVDSCDFYGVSAAPKDSIWVNNSTFRYYSTLYLYGNSEASCTILNCAFKDLTRNALYAYGNSVLLQNNSFADNKIEYYGDFISISAHAVEISNNNFSNNYVEWHNLISINGNVYLTNNNFTNNFVFGNHIYYTEYTILSLKHCDADIIGCSFINNSASTAGAIHCEDSGLLIENCSFKNNTHVTFDFSGVNLEMDGISHSYGSRILLDGSLNEVPNNVEINLAKSYTFSYPAKNAKIKVPVKLSYNNDMELSLFFHVSTNAAESFYLENGYYDSLDDLYCDQMRDSKNGYVTFYLDTLPVGTYIIKITDMEYGLEVTSKLKITKAKATVKAPKVTAKHKKSKFFKITVKSNKKAVKNLKVKVKVYTGKKYTAYTLKTNSKGIVQLNTKKLKKGSHKVVIASANKNYSLSAKSSIKIK